MKSVQLLYDEIGDHFSRTRQKKYGGGESTNWPVTDRYLERLKGGDTVLDLGCGNGKLVSGLPRGVNYVGTDFSRTLLAEAKRLHPKHNFRYGNVVSPSHWAKLGQYDAVFCVAVLHHLPEKKQQLYVLAEARKHLKKEGFLYLTVWNLWQKQFLQNHLDSEELKKTDEKWVEIPYNQKWKRFCVAFDVQSLSDLLRESGWKIEELFYADREGKKADIMTGQNLVCVAK